MTTKPPAIPAVPPTDAALHSFLSALKANIEMMSGQVGDGTYFNKQVEKAVLQMDAGTVTDNNPPGVVTGVSAEASLGTIFLSWLNPSDSDTDFVEIWESTTNTRLAANRIATPKTPPNGRSSYARSGLSAGVTRYYWLRAVDTSGNVGGWSHPDTAGFSATTASLVIDDFASSIKPVGRGSTLPSAATYSGDTFYLTPNGPFYRKISGAWTATTPASDITGQVVRTQISDGAISTAKLAAGAVDANIIAAGAVETSHLSALSVTSDILAAGSVIAGKIQSGSIYADRIVTNEIDTQWLKNNSLSNAGIGDYSGSLLLSTIPYTVITSINIPIEARGGSGAQTSILGTLYVDAVNLDTANSVGVWVDVAITGATSTFLTGGRMTIAPFNSNSFCVPVFFRTPVTGTLFLGVGAYAVLAGGSSSMAYIRQARLVPTAIFKS